MRKIVFLAILILIPGILVLSLALYEREQPPGWQPVLEGYFAHQREQTGEILTIQAVTGAGKPWDFTKEVDSAIDRLPSADYGAGSFQQVLTYPPIEVWCILLKANQPGVSGPSAYQLVFAARHRDLYNAGWVVHPASMSPFSDEVSQTLTKIGCSLDILQIAPPSALTMSR